MLRLLTFRVMKALRNSFKENATTVTVPFVVIVISCRVECYFTVPSTPKASVWVMQTFRINGTISRRAQVVVHILLVLHCNNAKFNLRSTSILGYAHSRVGANLGFMSLTTVVRCSFGILILIPFFSWKILLTFL